MLKPRANHTQYLLASLLVVCAFLAVACGGDDDDKPAQRTVTTQDGAGGGETSGSDADAGAGGSTGGANGGRNEDGASGPEGSGGATAPRVDRPVRRRTLARYLAKRYRLTDWYGSIVKIRIRGGHVRVYTSLDPEDDDESPPLVACFSVRAYSTRIESVTIYGETEKLVPTKILRTC